jgi:hypothetical protein
MLSPNLTQVSVWVDGSNFSSQCAVFFGLGMGITESRSTNCWEFTFKLSALRTGSNSYIDGSDARFIWEVQECSGILRGTVAGEFFFRNRQRLIEPKIFSRLAGSMHGP